MSVPTLYGISAELLNLMEAREAILADWALSNTDQTTSLAEVESAIREQVSALVRKVDGAAFYVREFEARAAAAKAEKERNRDREHMWEARGERLKEYIVSVMQMMGATRLDGDSNTLRLQKCPPSVDVVQPELVPSEYQHITVRVPRDRWLAFCEAWGKATNNHNETVLARESKVVEIEPVKTKIKEALKQQITCLICEGVGVLEVYAGHGDKRDEKCLACNGTGKVNQGVPGCSLVTDKMSLRVE